MRRLVFCLALAVACVWSTSVFAAGKNKPQEFKEQEMTDEKREAARNRGRVPMPSWQEGSALPSQDRPFPWMAVGLCIGLLAIAAPFAWGAYKRTAQELREADAFGPQSRRTRSKE
jgi:hypothetical protein